MTTTGVKAASSLSQCIRFLLNLPPTCYCQQVLQKELKLRGETLSVGEYCGVPRQLHYRYKLRLLLICRRQYIASLFFLRNLLFKFPIFFQYPVRPKVGLELLGYLSLRLIELCGKKMLAIINSPILCQMSIIGNLKRSGMSQFHNHMKGYPKMKGIKSPVAIIPMIAKNTFIFASYLLSAICFSNSRFSVRTFCTRSSNVSSGLIRL